jgi:hypothetical protein
VADRVLLADLPAGPPFELLFHRWHRQSCALFSSLQYNVLLTIDNVPAHAWSMEMAQTIVGSSCPNFELAPSTEEGSDLSRILVVTWSLHPDLIPNEVGSVIPEPDEPSVVGQPPLFLHASEIIHAKKDTL